MNIGTIFEYHKMWAMLSHPIVVALSLYTLIYFCLRASIHTSTRISSWFSEHGVKLQYFSVIWTTETMNQRLWQVGVRYRRFIRHASRIGLLFSLLAGLLGTYFLLTNFIAQISTFSHHLWLWFVSSETAESVHDSAIVRTSINSLPQPAPPLTSATTLVLALPGVTLPLSHAAPFFVAVLAAVTLHEAGHAIVAAAHGLPLARIGVFLTGLFPGAFVELPAVFESGRLSLVAKLHVALAGVLVNLLLAAAAATAAGGLSLALSPLPSVSLLPALAAAVTSLDRTPTSSSAALAEDLADLPPSHVPVAQRIALARAFAHVMPAPVSVATAIGGLPVESTGAWWRALHRLHDDYWAAAAGQRTTPSPGEADATLVADSSASPLPLPRAGVCVGAVGVGAPAAVRAELWRRVAAHVEHGSRADMLGDATNSNVQSATAEVPLGGVSLASLRPTDPTARTSCCYGVWGATEDDANGTVAVDTFAHEEGHCMWRAAPLHHLQPPASTEPNPTATVSLQNPYLPSRTLALTPSQTARAGDSALPSRGHFFCAPSLRALAPAGAPLCAVDHDCLPWHAATAPLSLTNARATRSKAGLFTANVPAGSAHNPAVIAERLVDDALAAPPPVRCMHMLAADALATQTVPLALHLAPLASAQPHPPAAGRDVPDAAALTAFVRYAPSTVWLAAAPVELVSVLRVHPHTPAPWLAGLARTITVAPVFAWALLVRFLHSLCAMLALLVPAAAHAAEYFAHTAARANAPHTLATASVWLALLAADAVALLQAVLQYTASVSLSLALLNAAPLRLADGSLALQYCAVIGSRWARERAERRAMIKDDDAAHAWPMPTRPFVLALLWEPLGSVVDDPEYTAPHAQTCAPDRVCTTVPECIEAAVWCTSTQCGDDSVESDCSDDDDSREEAARGDALSPLLPQTQVVAAPARVIARVRRRTSSSHAYVHTHAQPQHGAPHAEAVGADEDATRLRSIQAPGRTLDPEARAQSPLWVAVASWGCTAVLMTTVLLGVINGALTRA